MSDSGSKCELCGHINNIDLKGKTMIDHDKMQEMLAEMLDEVIKTEDDIIMEHYTSQDYAYTKHMSKTLTSIFGEDS